MIARAAVVWVVGLLTLVPWATWRLLFEAPTDEYALLITLVLFWVFGYWGLVGPLLAAIRVRRLFRSLEAARSREELVALLRSDDAREAAVDFVAVEYRLPRGLARRLCRLLAARLADAEVLRQATSPRGGARHG